MTKLTRIGDWIETTEALDRLPVGSVVVAPESEYGFYVAYQKTSDILSEDLKGFSDVWASIMYVDEQTSEDLINISYNNRLQLVFIQPA